MKKFVIGVFVGAALSFTVSAHADDIKNMIGKKVDDTAPVVVDGEQLSTQAIIIEGTSYAPVRAIGDALGKQVDWKEGKIILDKKQEEQTVSTKYSIEKIEWNISNLQQLIYGKKSDLEQRPDRIPDKVAYQKEIDALEAELKVWEARKAELESQTTK